MYHEDYHAVFQVYLLTKSLYVYIQQFKMTWKSWSKALENTLDSLENNRGLSRGPAQEHYMAAKCPVFLADWMKVEKASTHNKYKSGDRLSFCVSLEIIDLENIIKKFL